MLYKTHRKSDITGYIATIWLLSLTGVLQFQLFPFTKYNFYSIVALLVIFVGVRFGGHYPDFDHPPSNIKPRNFITVFISSILQLLKAKHRSRHTHSFILVTITWLILGILLNAGLTDLVYRFSKQGIDLSWILWILQLGYFGILMGIYFHLVADMMTSDGVYIFLNKKIAIVPNLRTKNGAFFKTGDTWEDIYGKLLNVINIILGILCVYNIIKF